jgi:hypothetical protein
MGLVNQCSLSTTNAWLYPGCLNGCEGGGEKLGRDPQIGQSMCWDIVGSPFLSGAVDLFNTVDDSTKGCHVRGLLIGSICGLAREAYVSCVSGFPYRVYIDSNRCDSQI